MSKNPITFNSGGKFAEHVVPEPTEGVVPALRAVQRRLRDQSTALQAEQDQAKATVSAATQQIIDMAAAGKSGKAIGDVLAEAGHARFNIATIAEQLRILGTASTRVGHQIFIATKSDPDWKQYLADFKRWRRIYDDARQALQRQHMENPIQPANASGDLKKKEANLEADRLNAERWQEWAADLADEMLFKFERENEEPAEDGTTKRRLRSRRG